VHLDLNFTTLTTLGHLYVMEYTELSLYFFLLEPG